MFWFVHAALSRPLSHPLSLHLATDLSSLSPHSLILCHLQAPVMAAHSFQGSCSPGSHAEKVFGFHVPSALCGP